MGFCVAVVFGVRLVACMWGSFAVVFLLLFCFVLRFVSILVVVRVILCGVWLVWG